MCSGELGLEILEERGHTLVVTSDKDGDNSVAAKEIVDADVVISQPFWPFYLTRELIEKQGFKISNYSGHWIRSC